MKRPTILTVLVVCVWALATISAYGDEEEIEKRSGTLKRPDKRSENVMFKVKNSDEGSQPIGMRYMDSFFKFKDVIMEGETLTFSWSPGTVDATCRLTKEENGGFVGKCQYADSDKTLDMTMGPPKTEE